MEILILSADDVKKALPMNTAIEVTKRAYSRLSSGRVQMPLRSRIHIPKQEGVLLTMPAAIIDDKEIAVKIVSVFGNNLKRGLPLIHAVVIVLDAMNVIKTFKMFKTIVVTVKYLLLLVNYMIYA